MIKLKLLSCLLSLWVVSPLSASEWTIETVAGTGVRGFVGDGGPALKAQLNDPFGVVRGPDGDLWFCEYKGQRIRKITKDGKVVTIVGSGKTGYTGDGGPALEVSMNLPHEIRFDAQGHLYFVDMANHVVRRMDAKTQIVTTVVGTGEAGYAGDGGPAHLAQLKQPHSIQFSPSGDLYICDIGNHVVRKVDHQTGVISTIAGTGKPGVTPDGADLHGTPLNGPRTLEFDAAGQLWLATREGNQVFRLDLQKQKIYHIAGTGKAGFSGNGGPAKQALLKGPKGLALDQEGNIWLADTESHTVRRVNRATGHLELMAGTGEKGDGADGDPLQCQMARLHGIFVDADGAVYIGDSEAHKIRVMRKR